MTTQEQIILNAEKELVLQLRMAIKAAQRLNRAHQGYDWDGDLDCNVDDRVVAEMLKEVYSAYTTGDEYDATRRDEIFK